jgi:hypothetical protein
MTVSEAASELNERIVTACGAMAAGPRSLRRYLEKPGPDFETASSADVDAALELLLATDPNHPARLRFARLLRQWDNAQSPDWAVGTARNSEARRARIYAKLETDAGLSTRMDELIPFYPLGEPLLIADRHEDWYAPVTGVGDYYWSTYARYLSEQRGWDERAILSMDNHTRAVVECLANPASPASYAARGLVMGYVQSGKTANFTGVVARAADAGYRLIIVLAGTWNILRNQTQRRFDKELLGKEFLANDQSYVDNLPPDWQEFLEHGIEPTALGHFGWQRLTRPNIDFKRLKAAIDNLEFEKHETTRPLNDPANLQRLPAKLLVVKKHAGILSSLVKDLGLLRTKLADLPTLIIDDESDQAGINTIDPTRRPASGESRSKTNAQIVKLLGLFPRGQYVGYTATPYANAVVDPDDPEDLFPKDFILPLDRPPGYMGISDFFDPNTVFADLDADDYSLAEIALIRRVESPIGADDEDLKRALRTYVLAGAMKLFRSASDPGRYKSAYFRHHTMLVHTSPKVGDMVSNAVRIKALWDACVFNTPSGLKALEKLWKEDLAKVCDARGEELVPSKFAELIPHLSSAIKHIEKGQQVYVVVNSDTKEAPDFSAAPVWKIVIGGNKLSRGYTVEGLTVSYYRRVSGNADTLMQMGRWFGFRPGYSDLVRVFLGVKEGKNQGTDLVSLFKGVCRMEERFREDITRYVREPGEAKITPKQIPPLISLAGTLPPTAKNKMFNAVIAKKNFGGELSMLTLSPTGIDRRKQNLAVATTLFAASKWLGIQSLGGTSSAGATLRVSAALLVASNDAVASFLRTYRWLETEFRENERPVDTSLQLEFLKKEKHGIKSWLVLAPQRKESWGQAINLGANIELTVKERHRDDGRGFQVFGEPAHRTVAEYLCNVKNRRTELSEPNEASQRLRDLRRAIVLLYPVREKPTDFVTIGFELLFPPNDLAFTVTVSAKRKTVLSPVISRR